MSNKRTEVGRLLANLQSKNVCSFEESQQFNMMLNNIDNVLYPMLSKLSVEARANPNIGMRKINDTLSGIEFLLDTAEQQLMYHALMGNCDE